jgi:hypothetical protein
METRSDLACPCCSEPLSGEDAVRIAATEVATSREDSKSTESLYIEQLACGHNITIHFDSPDSPRRLQCADVGWARSEGGGTIA